MPVQSDSKNKKCTVSEFVNLTFQSDNLSQEELARRAAALIGFTLNHPGLKRLVEDQLGKGPFAICFLPKRELGAIATYRIDNRTIYIASEVVDDFYLLQLFVYHLYSSQMVSAYQCHDRDFAFHRACEQEIILERASELSDSKMEASSAPNSQSRPGFWAKLFSCHSEHPKPEARSIQPLQRQNEELSFRSRRRYFPL